MCGARFLSNVVVYSGSVRAQLPSSLGESWFRCGVIHMSRGSLGLHPLISNDQKGSGDLGHAVGV